MHYSNDRNCAFPRNEWFLLWNITFVQHFVNLSCNWNLMQHPYGSGYLYVLWTIVLATISQVEALLSHKCQRHMRDGWGFLQSVLSQKRTGALSKFCSSQTDAASLKPLVLQCILPETRKRGIVLKFVIQRNWKKAHRLTVYVNFYILVLQSL